MWKNCLNQSLICLFKLFACIQFIMQLLITNYRKYIGDIITYAITGSTTRVHHIKVRIRHVVLESSINGKRQSACNFLSSWIQIIGLKARKPGDRSMLVLEDDPSPLIVQHGLKFVLSFFFAYGVVRTWRSWPLELSWHKLQTHSITSQTSKKLAQYCPLLSISTKFETFRSCLM